MQGDFHPSGAIPAVVVHLCHRLCDLLKTNLSFMCTSRPIRKLFYAPMWVLTFSLFVGCDDKPLPIAIDQVNLPDDHREVNWMDVLDRLPQSKSRKISRAYLHDMHSEFWQVWCEDILQLGAAEDTMTIDVLDQFLAQMAPMLAAIDSTSGSEDVIDRESRKLKNGLKRFKVIEPDLAIPDVIWMPSGFNFAIYPGPSWIGVGLDWFLGSDHPLHRELPPAKFPNYRLARMRPDRMACDALLGWIAVNQQELVPTSPRTADMWLFWGKVMHTASRCLPDVSPAQLMNWTEEEWEWAVAHERATWAEIQPQERMFSNAPRDVMRWFQEGPFTRVGRLPQESPDRLGIFLGWRAVEAALQAYPESTDSDVLGWVDPQPVLRAYRP